MNKITATFYNEFLDLLDDKDLFFKELINRLFIAGFNAYLIKDFNKLEVTCINGNLSILEVNLRSVIEEYIEHINVDSKVIPYIFTYA